jgi:hypothetical protein
VVKYLVFALLLVAVAGAQPVSGQTHSSSIGLNAGAVLYSSFNDGIDAAVDLRPDANLTGSLQYDWIVGDGNLAFRLGAHYQRMELDWANGRREIYAYAGDFDLILRPVRPRASTRVIPFLTLGAGATQYRFGEGGTTSFPDAGVSYSGNQRFQFSVVGGLGFDIVTGWRWDENNFLIRLEAQDSYVVDSPFEPLSPDGSLGGVHNLRVTLGLHNTMGILR